MKPPARPTSPAPRQAPPAPRAAQPAARATQTAPRTPTTTAARPAPRDHKKLVIIGAVVAVALAVIGYGLSRPSEPWVFDSPEAKKSYVH